MKNVKIGLVALLIALTGCTSIPHTTAKVSVTYDHPEQFTDFKSSYTGSAKDREILSDEMTRLLQEMVSSYLPDSATLEMKFTNIDLAGDYEPWHGPQAQDIRIMKDIYPPRLAFTFKLIDGSGKTVAEGDRSLQDLNYLLNTSFNLNTSEPLHYERGVLEDWMRQEFRKG